MADKKKVLDKIKKEYLIIAAIVGVFMMLIGRESSFKDTNTEISNISVSDSLESDFFSSYDGNELEYITYLTECTKKCLENMEGVGAAEVFLTIEPSESTYAANDVPVIQGIMVVAEGAENPVVVQDITEACEALFSLSAHKIKVVRMKEET